jgi:uncharacterized membrane protein
MSENTKSLPAGAGATTGGTASGASASGGFIGSGHTAPAQSGSSGGGERFEAASESGRFQQDQHESGYRPEGRAVLVTEQPRSRPSTATIVGAALAGAIAGGALPFMLSGRSSSKRSSTSRSETATVEESVVIDRPARELYDFWRDFTNLPQFMDNIRSVEKLGEKRSHWVIKAPAGTSVEFDSRVTEDVPGRLIAWTSEEGATVPNRGRVEFIEGSSGGGTTVRATISYDPPAGAAGRVIAKLFQREPGTQAKQDLARLKALMEGGAKRHG